MEKVWYCDDEIEFTVQSAKFPEGTDPKEMLITMSRVTEMGETNG